MKASTGLRVWYQSFTDHDETRLYHDRLEAHLNAAASEGNRIEVVGMRPPARKHRITELRCALEAVRNAVRAEREGYDAFILGHFQDAGLWEARSAVKIPVVGLGESAMLHACTLGHSIGLVTIHPLFISIHHDQIRRYGLEHRVVSVVAVDSSAGDYVRAFADPEAARALAAEYERKIGDLVKQGIEVVLPAGGLPSLLFGAQMTLSAAPAAVLDSTAIAVKSAEMAVDLMRFNGTAPSRAGAFIAPTDAAFEAIGVPPSGRSS
jgi:allantoin racemase